MSESDLIDGIRYEYRWSKAAQKQRIRLKQAIGSMALWYLTGWRPDLPEAERRRFRDEANALVDAVWHAKAPPKGQEAAYAALDAHVAAAKHASAVFEQEEAAHKRTAQKLARDLPAWQVIEANRASFRGFSPWGLATIIGEAGDLSLYSGVRKLYKRLGAAPDECYATGEKSKGRMRPRATYARMYADIAEPLLRQQWRSARKADGEERSLNVPDGHQVDDPLLLGRPIGPYGAVYGAAKERALARGLTRMHAERLARRAMVKALIHDVYAAWHGRPLDFGGGKGEPQLAVDEVADIQPWPNCTCTTLPPPNHSRCRCEPFLSCGPSR